MLSKKMQLFLSGVFLTIIVMKPNAPVLAGVALLTLVMTGARRDLASSSAKKRWAAFKRLAVLSITGSLLVAVGVGIQSAPWQMTLDTAAQARHAMAVLTVYSVALIGAPSLAWSHISLREPKVKSRNTQKSAATTLKNVACIESIQRIQLAS